MMTGYVDTHDFRVYQTRMERDAMLALRLLRRPSLVSMYTSGSWLLEMSNSTDCVCVCVVWRSREWMCKEQEKGGPRNVSPSYVCESNFDHLFSAVWPLTNFWLWPLHPDYIAKVCSALRADNQLYFRGHFWLLTLNFIIDSSVHFKIDNSGMLPSLEERVLMQFRAPLTGNSCWTHLSDLALLKVVSQPTCGHS